MGRLNALSLSRLVVSPKKPAADDQRDAEREKREVPSKLVTAFVDVVNAEELWSMIPSTRLKTREHVVPLHDLVQEDSVHEPAQAQAEKDSRQPQGRPRPRFRLIFHAPGWPA